MKNIFTLSALIMADELGLLPTPYEEAVKFQYCGECSMLSVKERNQKRGKKHFCNRYNRQVFHMGMHPEIVRVPECDEVVSENAAQQNLPSACPACGTLPEEAEHDPTCPLATASQ